MISDITIEPHRSAQPLLVTIRPARSGIRPASWARENRERIRALLSTHGAILWSGFELADVASFEAVARTICADLYSEYGDLPPLAGMKSVYGVTPYPANLTILYHNEASHTPAWPAKQLFYCVKQARQGGENRLVDGRRVLGALRAADPALVARFAGVRLRYIRNFTPLLDVPWQQFFRTDDRAQVEARCRAEGIWFEWKDRDSLQTRRLAPAIIHHPVTGEPVWFNQIQLHHVACVDDKTRKALLSLFKQPQNLPRHVQYGDGSEIDDATVALLGTILDRESVGVTLKPGEMLLLDNMLVAHSRGPFEGERQVVATLGELTQERDVQLASV
jgi:alpha-ketoglutarate-dependent taurine dioxygenase